MHPAAPCSVLVGGSIFRLEQELAGAIHSIRFHQPRLKADMLCSFGQKPVAAANVYMASRKSFTLHSVSSFFKIGLSQREDMACSRDAHALVLEEAQEGQGNK